MAGLYHRRLREIPLAKCAPSAYAIAIGLCIIYLESGGKAVAERRRGPYIWATWLTKLLVGENSCEWSVWFRAHYKNYRKAPDNFDSVTWIMNHTEMLNDVKSGLEKEWNCVFTERQNYFNLRGSSATIAGTPDLIALTGDRGVIYDVKTGQPTASDHVQVMTYMYAIPRALGQYKGMTFDGAVVYRDHEVAIPASAVDEQFISRLAALIRKVAGDLELAKTPSGMECDFCPISKEVCPERMEKLPAEWPETQDF